MFLAEFRKMEFNSTDDFITMTTSTVTSESNASLNNTNLTLRCGVLDDNYMRVWSSYQWWCEGIFFTGIGIVSLSCCFNEAHNYVNT